MYSLNKDSPIAGIFFEDSKSCFHHFCCLLSTLPQLSWYITRWWDIVLLCYGWAQARVLRVSQTAAQADLRDGECHAHLITSQQLLPKQHANSTPPPDVGDWSQLTLQDSGNTPSSHRDPWHSSAAANIRPLMQVFQCGLRDMKMPRCEHPEPKAQADCPTCSSQGTEVSLPPGLGSELPGSWRSSAALPWPQQCLDNQEACRSSWSEVDPQNCGMSYRCDCRQCWEAEELEAQSELDRSVYQTCKQLSYHSITFHHFKQFLRKRRNNKTHDNSHFLCFLGQRGPLFCLRSQIYSNLNTLSHHKVYYPAMEQTHFHFQGNLLSWHFQSKISVHWPFASSNPNSLLNWKAVYTGNQTEFFPVGTCFKWGLLRKVGGAASELKGSWKRHRRSFLHPARLYISLWHSHGTVKRARI